MSNYQTREKAGYPAFGSLIQPMPLGGCFRKKSSGVATNRNMHEQGLKCLKRSEAKAISSLNVKLPSVARLREE